MSPEQWQIALRQQYGKEQHFGFENLGSEPVFSEFAVNNPDTELRAESRAGIPTTLLSTRAVLNTSPLGARLFIGSVRSELRPQLVEQVCQDPTCRVFLSTDAGAVGLNLQHASTVVNLDLPWNPALLEQRIGRVYRMGQKRPVRVINFISKGSIEEGMLSVLAFKRALAAGILDGAGNEISLGGSRLTRFMKEVENVAAQMPECAPIAADEELAATALQEKVATSGTDADHTLEAARAPEPIHSPHLSRSGASADTAPLATLATAIPAQASVQDLLQAHAQPLQTLLGVALQWLSTLATQAANPAPTGTPRMGVVRDPVNGERYLKLPAPEPETLDQMASALDALARALRGK